MNLIEKANKDGAKVYWKTAWINFRSGEVDAQVITNEIDEKEKIIVIVTGFMRKRNSRGMATGKESKGILIVTDRKLVFADKGLLRKNIITIEAADISSVSTSKTFFGSGIEIMTPAAGYTIFQLKEQAAVDAINAITLTKEVAKKKATTKTTETKVSTGMDEVKKAKELLDMGAITKKEFEAIKKKHIK